MSFPITMYLYCVVGILVSILLPIIRKMIPSATLAFEQPEGSFWDKAKPYVAIGVFSLLTAVLLVAVAGDQVRTWTWKTAILAGYLWDSTLQKIIKP